MKLKSYVFIFILLLLLVPSVSARDKLKLKIDIDSWIEDDGTNNISKFTLKLNSDERDLDIEDIKIYTIENKTEWDGTVTLRFDYSNESYSCNNDIDNLSRTIVETCQLKTEEIVSAKKIVETSKQACDTDLTKCTTEKTTFSDKAGKYDGLETNYNICTSDKNSCVIEKDKYKKTDDNLWLYLGLAVLAGMIIAYFINIKNIVNRVKRPPEMKETSQSLHGDF